MTSYYAHDGASRGAGAGSRRRRFCAARHCFAAAVVGEPRADSPCAPRLRRSIANVIYRPRDCRIFRHFCAFSSMAVADTAWSPTRRPGLTNVVTPSRSPGIANIVSTFLCARGDIAADRSRVISYPDAAQLHAEGASAPVTARRC